MAVVAIVICLGILVAALTAYSPYPLATSLVAGLGFIWFVVRLMNYRDDPHFKKPPPGPP